MMAENVLAKKSNSSNALSDGYRPERLNREMSYAYTRPEPDKSFDIAVEKVKKYAKNLKEGNIHRQYAADLLKTALSLKQGKNAPGMPLQLQMTPGFGDAYDASEAIKYLGKSEYGKAALSGIGILPFIPGMAGIIAGKGAKVDNIEYHWSTEPDLIPGKTFAEQQRTVSSVGERGLGPSGEGDFIYSTKDPESWMDQFEMELGQDAPEAIPQYLYKVEVNNTSPDGYLGQASNVPADVKVLKRVNR